MIELTIEVSESDISEIIEASKYMVLGSVSQKALEAYEAKRKEINPGDWCKILYTETHFCIMRVAGGQKTVDEAPPHMVYTRLPGHLQKSLNEWMDSL